MNFNMIDLEKKTTANAYEDLPLWSAKPGMLLLDNLKLKKNIKVLDIGCGTGFPTLEIAQRIGNSSIVYGLDPWGKGLEKAKEKAEDKEISNVIFVKGKSQNMPFDSDFFDIIVSNNGFNGKNGNVQVFKECYRILKNKGNICFTAILPSSMRRFYKIFIKAMKENNVQAAKKVINQHINQKRLTIKKYKENLKLANFNMTQINKTSFKINFADEEAFFNYYFFRLNFIIDWLSLIPQRIQKEVMKTIKEEIREEIAKKKHFSIKIDCVYLCCIKK